jgi:hypothetical protein
MLGNTMGKSRPPLELLSFFMFIGVVLFGSLEFYAERGEWFKPYSCAGASGGDCPHGKGVNAADARRRKARVRDACSTSKRDHRTTARKI